MGVGIVLAVLMVVVAAVCMVANMLIGWKRGWIMELISAGATLLSVGVACPLAKRVTGGVIHSLGSFALRMVAEPAVVAEEIRGTLLFRLPLGSAGEWLDQALNSVTEVAAGMDNPAVDYLLAVPVGGEGLMAMLSILLAPVVYLILFVLIRGLLAVPLWFTGWLLLPFRNYSIVPSGLVNGAVMTIALLIPVTGFAATGSHLLRAGADSHLAEMVDLRAMPAVQSMLSEDVQTGRDALLDVADSLDEALAPWNACNLFGNAVYESLTTVTLDVEATHGVVMEMDLDHELVCAMHAAGQVTEAAGVLAKEDFTEADKEVLYATADAFFESEWIGLVATDTLVVLADSWTANRPFLGVSRPVMDANLNPTLNCILETLSHESPDTLEEDIRVVLDVTGDLLASDVLVAEQDYLGLVRRLGESGLLTKVLAKLDANPRLHPLSVELKALSIRLITNILGVDRIDNGEFDQHLDSMASTLTGALDMPKEERDQLVIEGVQDALADQELDLPDDVILEISNKMMEDLGEDGEITGDELKQYMKDHADEAFDLGVEIDPDDIPDELPDGALN